MLHRTARLTPFGRRLLVGRIVVEGWPPATAAEMLGVSRATAYKWLRRYRSEGLAGLDDRPARPHRRPRALPDREVRRILIARRRLRVGPHRLGPLLGHPRSTVYGVLRRHGLSRLAHADHLTGAPVRYVREWPGELVHVDVKRLGRVPPGGGHRILGEERPRKALRSGDDYLHVAIDDASRVAYVAVPPGRACRQHRHLHPRKPVAFFASHGVPVERVMTDNAMTYTRSACPGRPVCRPRDPSPAGPSAATPDQRQGRTVHRDAPARMGVRTSVPLKRGAPLDLAWLGRCLQSATSPRRTRWQDPDGRPRQQGRGERHLGAREEAGAGPGVRP